MDSYLQGAMNSHTTVIGNRKQLVMITIFAIDIGTDMFEQTV